MKKQYEYAVSACLCGFCCRYDGKSKPDERISALYESGKALPVCPEQLGGLTTPRTPCEIVDGKVISSDGEDRTQAYIRGSERVLALCREYGIKKAVLKQNSPSCGSSHIYDGTFSGRLIEGAGVTAKLLSENGIEVSGEKD